MKLIATVGDQETQSNAHIPPVGGGTYPISPSNPKNTFVYIKGNLVLVNGDTFEAHGTATLVASSNLFFINGNAVVRDGDSITHHHSNSGVEVIQQDFARSE